MSFCFANFCWLLKPGKKFLSLPNICDFLIHLFLGSKCQPNCNSGQQFPDIKFTLCLLCDCKLQAAAQETTAEQTVYYLLVTCSQYVWEILRKDFISMKFI